MAKQEVAITTFVNSAELPAHIAANASGLGNENVGSQDMAVSSLNLIQQLSPQLQDDNASYIEGAKVGHLFDSVTGELHEQAFLVNLYFEKSYPIFRKREAGQGMEGRFKTREEAQAHFDEAGLSKDEWAIVETDMHACLMLDPVTGQAKKPIVLYMSGSKLKISKAWNTAIATRAMADGRSAGVAALDRFAYVWVMRSAKEKNAKGQPYQNYRIDFAGTISDPKLFEEAKANYLAMSNRSSN